jgi:hypothetical protein
LAAAWVWLVLLPLWLQSGYQVWLGVVTMVTAPAGATLTIGFAARERLRRRRAVHG